MKTKTGIMLVALITLLTACGEKTVKSKHNYVKERNELTEGKPPKITVHYILDTLADQAEIDTFRTHYSLEQQHVILQLNRFSTNRLRKGIVLCIPDTLLSSFANYTTFPTALKKADTLPKLILVSLRIQSFALYETGKLIRCGPVSSGSKIHPTPPGKYHTNWKAKVKISTINNEWIMPWYFNIENKQGIALHQYVLPGYPASHSCIRLEEEDAKWIYDWADPWTLDSNRIQRNGTPVIVFGTYDFNGIQPWRLLPENPNAMELTPEEWNEIGF